MELRFLFLHHSWCLCCRLRQLRESGRHHRQPSAWRRSPLTVLRIACARSQPTVPSTYEEMPFVETAAEPELTPAEKQRGYLLFHRPITEPVYPNSKPRAHERLEQLVAFAAPGEFEPLTFSIYPVRKLQNLKVRCSPLTCDAGEIPEHADHRAPGHLLECRVSALYLSIHVPAYARASRAVTVHSSPAGECQRYWLRVHVPEDAKPGLYRGTVSVWDDGFEKAVQIPVALRVLGFQLTGTPPSTTRPTTTCATGPSTRTSPSRSFRKRPPTSTGRWSNTAWI